MKAVRIGSGAGYSGDRIEPAVELAERGGIRYLVFECLAERTIAIAQQARRHDPGAGYDPLLADRMQAVLGVCRRNGVRVVTNMGAANPTAAAARVGDTARALGLRGLKIAAISGDDVLAAIRGSALALDETGETIASLGDRIVSANAYIGAAPIAEALGHGADVVITGRAADPSLFLAPMMHEFGWREGDWDRLGKGTVAGHLLECAGQVTGGYFADPGYKDVADLARLGFPIAEVTEDGTTAITKVSGSGGRVSVQTCKEQLLYELHDPTRYLTPDVTADFSGVSFEPDGHDRVRVRGGTGRARPATLKVSVGYLAGFLGEGQISYAGPGAAARGRLALDIVAERLALIGARYDEIRYDLIGMNAIHGAQVSSAAPEPYEVRVRVAARTGSLREAARIGNEVETLYTNGPAGGGGVTKIARDILAMGSCAIPREAVRCTIAYQET
jgi:Acyclic terpene utilisation family protein AtuA